MKKRIAILHALVIFAALLSSNSFALEKVGTTSMQVLKTSMGVRGIAMGNAMVATVEGAEAAWWNPGALVKTKKNQVEIAQINMPADIQMNSLSYSRPWGEYGAFSAHLINLFTDDMKVRTIDYPEGNGENFNASDFVLGVGYAQRLTDKFSLGGNLRFLHSALEEATYSGLAVDLGTLYQTNLRSMRLGMAIQSLGPDVKYSGDYLDYREAGLQQSDPQSEEFEGAALPTMFRLGVSFDVEEMFGMKPCDKSSATMAIEMDHPNDNKERLNFGAEYDYMKTLFVRAGGKFGYDTESFSAGFGLRFDVMNEYALTFDYAYSHWGAITEAGDGFMDQPHRLAVGFGW
jgi:long-subunit fatty acid transport protein